MPDIRCFLARWRSDVPKTRNTHIKLANLAFAMPALAQIRDPETLPQAQSANAKSLVAKALTAVDAMQWPAAEAALKQLVSAEPRWEYARRSQIAARAGAALPHQPIPDARP